MDRLQIAWTILCVICTNALRAEEPPAGNFEVEKLLDLAYRDGEGADRIKHKLDIYLPKGVKRYPVVIFVHGGSWKSGDKSLYTPYGQIFAKHGIGVVVVNYRLTTAENGVKHPDHVRDVADAFAWVRANIAKYNGDPDRIVLSGHSAGAHLVSLLATDESYLQAVKCSLKDVRGVIALSGVYSIVPAIPIFVRPFGMDADICKKASPLTHVCEKRPPFLIAYADEDFPGIEQMSKDFSGKLKENRCDAELVKCKDRNHISIIIQLAMRADDPCTTAMLNFIRRVTK